MDAQIVLVMGRRFGLGCVNVNGALYDCVSVRVREKESLVISKSTLQRSGNWKI